MWNDNNYYYYLFVFISSRVVPFDYYIILFAVGGKTRRQYYNNVYLRFTIHAKRPVYAVTLFVVIYCELIAYRYAYYHVYLLFSLGYNDIIHTIRGENTENDSFASHSIFINVTIILYFCKGVNDTYHYIEQMI